MGFVSVNGNDEADVEKYDITDLCPFDDSATPCPVSRRPSLQLISIDIAPDLEEFPG